VLEKYDAEVVRFFILRAHYRSPLNYSDVHLDDAKVSLTRLYTALRGREVSTNIIDWNDPQAVRFKEAMDDDFNTPEAMAVLFDLARTKSAESIALLKKLGAVIGLLQRNPDDFLQGQVATVSSATYDSDFVSGSITTGLAETKINDLILSRVEAKKAKNFAEADRIRKELADAGIILEDTPQGTTWRRA
jgi:cysteinyl-tRNA synthetase